VLVELGVVEADVVELRDEQAAELELARGARAALPLARGLRVDADVAQEAFQDLVGEGGREGRGEAQNSPPNAFPA
jgi:hypothetical protein